MWSKKTTHQIAVKQLKLKQSFTLISLVVVVLVVCYITVRDQSPLDKGGHGTPAQQDDRKLQKVPFVLEVKPALLLH